MAKKTQHTLSSLQVAISIVTMHYGLGMLVGSGQDIAKYGPSGMIYAVSTAVGTLGILFFSRFYWKKFFPIWDLIKEKYDKKSGAFVTFLSGFWMIGVIASFIICGQAAAIVFGVPMFVSTIILLFAIYIFSLFSYGWLSKMFFAMLITGSVFLLTALFQTDISWLFRAPYLFVVSLPRTMDANVLGVFVSTVLLTVIGMDFHQFVVRGKSPKISNRGIVVASLLLLLISFVIGAVVLGAMDKLPQMSGIQVIPEILLWSGTNLLGSFGFIFVLPVLFVAIGSGSGLLKIVAESARIYTKHNVLKNKYILNAALLVVAFIISLTSKSVIVLITDFYAIYVASVFIPFLVYIYEEKTKKRLVKRNDMFKTIFYSFSSSFGVYLLGASQLIILLAGFIYSILTLVLCYTREHKH